jgi:hypothetical protein
MKIQFIDKEQDWANETTRYWFDVDGNDYCIADKNGDLILLDGDGCAIHTEANHIPLIGQGNASDRKIYNALIVEREKHLND